MASMWTLVAKPLWLVSEVDSEDWLEAGGRWGCVWRKEADLWKEGRLTLESERACWHGMSWQPYLSPLPLPPAPVWEEGKHTCLPVQAEHVWAEGLVACGMPCHLPACLYIIPWAFWAVMHPCVGVWLWLAFNLFCLWAGHVYSWLPAMWCGWWRQMPVEESSRTQATGDRKRHGTRHHQQHIAHIYQRWKMALKIIEK